MNIVHPKYIHFATFTRDPFWKHVFLALSRAESVFFLIPAAHSLCYKSTLDACAWTDAETPSAIVVRLLEFCHARGVASHQDLCPSFPRPSSLESVLWSDLRNKAFREACLVEYLAAHTQLKSIAQRQRAFQLIQTWFQFKLLDKSAVHYDEHLCCIVHIDNVIIHANGVLALLDGDKDDSLLDGDKDDSLLDGDKDDSLLDGDGDKNDPLDEAEP